jgi:ferredoxin
MKVRVAADLCCGAQRCAVVAPEAYKLEAGYNVLAGKGEPWSVPLELEQQAIRGARACPESAITIIDEN